VVKAVALLSGGLDSRLAIRVVQDQGLEVHAINYVSCFSTYMGKARRQSEAARAAEQLGVPLKIIPISKRLIEIVKNPKHGYGKNMNPCIDCRILTFRLAKEHMKRIGASFMITGEVLGQRPMSQRRDAMRLIDKKADVQGLVLRPLSAKHLLETIPEREGWIDREKLLSITGRSRKEQIRLAEHYGIRDYPSAAGGCLLTYEGFANKVQDLLAHKDADINDMLLLRVGRHFRLPQGGKAVVGKDKEQNRRILQLARKGDIVFRPQGNLPAPTALLRDSNSSASDFGFRNLQSAIRNHHRRSHSGSIVHRGSDAEGTPASEEEIAITADLCISHSKLRTEPFIPIECYRYESPSEIRIINAKAMPRETIDSLRI